MNRLPKHPLAGPVTVPFTGPATFTGDPENFIELGYGTGPRCIECRRNVSGCLCNVEDIDVPHVDEMKRIMPELFEGWGLAERSAYGMGGKL